MLLRVVQSDTIVSEPASESQAITDRWPFEEMPTSPLPQTPIESLGDPGQRPHRGLGGLDSSLSGCDLVDQPLFMASPVWIVDLHEHADRLSPGVLSSRQIPRDRAQRPGANGDGHGPRAKVTVAADGGRLVGKDDCPGPSSSANSAHPISEGRGVGGQVSHRSSRAPIMQHRPLRPNANRTGPKAGIVRGKTCSGPSPLAIG